MAEENGKNRAADEKVRMGAFEDIGRALDRELQRLVEFVNERVVPAARQDSEVLLRRTARVLDQLADRLTTSRQEAAGQSPPEEKKSEPR